MKAILRFPVCAILSATAVCFVQAQPGPGGGAPGAGFGRGGMPGMFGRGMQSPPGPPSPVPPEVAMARPTQAEVDRMNADLKSFIDSSSDKDLLKKYESLLTVQLPRNNSAIRPTQTFVRTTERHNGFVDTAKNGDFDILFEGDSITDFWQNSGTNAFNKHFGGMKEANFAVSGDTTQGVLWGLQNGEGQGHKPKAVMLMIGTNNGFQGNTGPEIAEGVGAIVYELRKDFPEAKIMLLAIFPRGANADDANRKKNEETNKIIAKLNDGKNVFFTDINSKFLKENGSLIGFGADNLHPNAEGYEIWAQAVESTLKSWVN